MQLLLDELELVEQGLVDSATAARSGHLLGVGRIVQGRIGGNEALLKLQAAVVGMDEPTVRAPISDQDALRRLLDMEARLGQPLDLAALVGARRMPKFFSTGIVEPR